MSASRVGVYVFLSVTMAHNAIVCLCMWLLEHLLLRGALKDINTVEELLEYKGAQIYIKED